MTIHEFGIHNDKIVLLVHPSLVMWDYFEYVIPLMENKYHLVIPALPGYDKETNSDFTSIEKIASELERFLSGKNKEIACIYGCSMGGSVITRILADNSVDIQSAVIDGGITPYQLPYLITRFIALKDFLLIYSGKLGGIKLLEKAFNTDEYSEEDLEYAADILKRTSCRTIWNTFDSCNNYTMPDIISAKCRHIEYWFAETERKARRDDIRYIQKNFPQTRFRCVKNTGHAGLAVLYPDKFVHGIERLYTASQM